MQDFSHFDLIFVPGKNLYNSTTLENISYLMMMFINQFVFWFCNQCEMTEQTFPWINKMGLCVHWATYHFEKILSNQTIYSKTILSLILDLF